MLIRTQNKMGLVLFENIEYIGITSLGSDKYQITASQADCTFGLGKYNSKGACMEVLENIYYCYGNKCICYQMPEVIEDE